jgi:hypothetical protein
VTKCATTSEALELTHRLSALSPATPAATTLVVTVTPIAVNSGINGRDEMLVRRCSSFMACIWHKFSNITYKGNLKSYGMLIVHRFVCRIMLKAKIY